jgi:uncharacterized RDD family membrane protein YckC
MKCPKCEYLGFESSDRCRNCGYEFSLTPSVPVIDPLDLPVDTGAEEPLIASPDAIVADVRPRLDLNRIIGGPPEDLPLFPPSHAEFEAVMTTPPRPRAPLSVRRTTPEIPREMPRSRAKTAPPSGDMLFEQPPVGVLGQHAQGRHSWTGTAPISSDGERPASALTRIVAALVDVSLLSALDAVVLYFTLRLLGLTAAAILELRIIPLAAFFILLDGGYLVAFTAVGGQSIGKMALGIKVIGRGDESVSIPRATVRTFAYLVSALPLGAGFLPGVIGAERLALHDRLAHTRVVQLS